MAKVIASFVLKNKETGDVISPYGVLPYGTRNDWASEVRGWTIEWPDGSIGNGQAPFATRVEAEEYAKANANFPGMTRFTD